MAKCRLETTLKVFLVLINVIFIAVGFVIAAFGIIISTGSNLFGGYIEPLLRDAGGTSSVGSFFSYVTISAAVLGGIIFIVALIGACGGCLKTPCLLYTYVAMITLILVVEIAVVAVCIVKWDWVTSQLKTGLQSTLDNSYSGPTATDSLSIAWNYAFVTFQCCGVTNSSDLSAAKKWNTTDKVPATCCKVHGSFPNHSAPIDSTCPTNPTTGNSYYDKGCYNSIQDLILKYNDYIIAIAASVASLQIITLVIAIVLARSGRKLHPIKGD